MLQRRWLSVAVLSACSAATFCASAQAVELTEIVYNGHGPAWRNFLESQAKAFEALHPGVHITFVDSGGSEADKLKVLLAAGTPPDVTDFYPNMAAPFIGTGTFLDLTPLVKSSGVDLSALMPPAVESFRANGRLWGLPVDLYPVVSWFNADLFSQAGLPTPYQTGLAQWTWERVLTDAKKLTVRDPDGKLRQLGLDRLTARPYIQINQAGGRYYDRLVDPTASRWNTPAVIEGLSFIKRAVVDDRTALPSADANFYFWTGRSAIDLVDGPGIIGAFMTQTKFNWDVAPQPKGPANDGTFVTSGIGLQILAASPHVQEAWAWLQFVALRAEAAEAFIQSTGRVPTLMKVTPTYRRYVPAAPPHWDVFSSAALNPASFPGYLVPDSRVPAAENSVLAQLWQGKIPPQIAAEQIDAQVSALLKEDHSR